MRKYGLLAAAVGLALGGSVAKADFTISSSRVANGNGTDTVTFKVLNSGTGTTLGLNNLQVANVALYAPTTLGAQSFPNNGLFISTDQSIDATHGGAGVLGTSAGGLSVIPNTGSLAPIGSPSVVLLNQTIDPTGSNNTYTEGQKVAGIGGTVGNLGRGSNSTIGTGLVFAIAVVPTGNPVEVLQTTPNADAPGNRTLLPTFQFSGTQFTATNATGAQTTLALQATNNVNAFVDVPEPASLGVIGLAMGGLLSRRRRSA